MDVFDLETARDWVPFLINPLDWENFLANKDLYPFSLSLTKDSFYLHQAFSRYQLMRQAGSEGGETEKVEEADRRKERKAERSEEKKKLVLTAKFLKTAVNPGLALLLALDVHQPREILEVYGETDKVQERLGVVISLTDIGPKKKILGKVAFTLGKKQVLEIKPEEILVLQVDRQTSLELDFRLAAAQVLGKKRAKISVSGGRVGVVIDSRGRPIVLGEGEEGWKKIRRWTKVFQN